MLVTLLAWHSAYNAQGAHARYASTSGRPPPSEDADAPGFELKAGPPGSVRWAVMMPASPSLHNGHIHTFLLSPCTSHFGRLGRCRHTLPYEEFISYHTAWHDLSWTQHVLLADMVQTLNQDHIT